MAFAIIGGLAVATVLTLIFLPALYVAWFRITEPHTAEIPVEAETQVVHA
jgi:Cu/Ag efflux pump CusA